MCVFIFVYLHSRRIYRAELLKQCSSVKNKAIGVFFEESEIYMHKVDVGAKK